MNRKPDIRDMEAILERIRRDKAKTDNPNPDLPKAAPTTSFRPKEVYSGPTKETVEPVEDDSAQVNPELPVAVPLTQRKPVDYNRGDLFLPITPAEPQTPSPPKAASTDRREERKPATNADKSDADRLLDVWEQKHPYEMRHREQVIDMAIYAGLFISVPGREAKWKAIEPALVRWEDEGKITAWLGGMYQINPLKFENLR